jgi:membrane-anchored glycerophosphoryl diester phosphodiesterase (GDPDase)
MEMAAFGLGSSIGYLTSSAAISITTSLASDVLTGLLIISVSQSVLGRVISLKDLWAQAKGQMWRLVGLTVLLGLINVAVFGVVVLVAFLLIGGVAMTAGDGGAAVAVLVTLLLVLGALVLAVFLAVRLGLAAPALMLERAGVGGALKRSWALTGGQFWRIFGVLALALIIVGALNAILLVPVSAITALAPAATALSATMLVVSSVISVLISALTMPFLSAVLALIYIDVRIRKEALDVELARAAGAA